MLDHVPPMAGEICVVTASREFVLRVESEYAIVIVAPSIEDAKALALAEEWPERRRARLIGVGDEGNQCDFVVGG